MANIKNKLTANKILAFVVLTAMLFSFLTIFPTSTVLAAQAGPGTYIVTTSAGLNVRSGPGTNYTIINGIPYGNSFTVTQTSNEWGYASSPYNGWVSLTYAALQSSSNSMTSADIPNGYYVISSMLNNSKVIDIYGGYRDNGTSAILYDFQYSDNQIFHFERLSDGTYRIKAKHSGLYLEVRNSSRSNGADVAQWEWQDSYACKHWYIIDAENGHFKFVNKESGKAMDVQGGNTANGTRIQQYEFNGTKSQYFKLYSVSIDEPAIRGAEDAIRWATARVGSHDYDRYCLQFVSDAYNSVGVSIGSYGMAKECANAKTKYKDFNPPRGAFVFFDYIASDGRNLGHVGISLGNGTFIHAASGQGVIISTLKGYSDSRYLGWSYPSK